MEEGKKKKEEEIARSYFNLNQGNHSREATFTTGNCCSRRYSSNSGGIVHWKRQGKMSFLPFPLPISLFRSCLSSVRSLSLLPPHTIGVMRSLIIFQTHLEISATRGWTFTFYPGKFTFVLRISTSCATRWRRGSLFTDVQRANDFSQVKKSLTNRDVIFFQSLIKCLSLLFLNRRDLVTRHAHAEFPLTLFC